jgi:putative iron-dependent peroxidase
MPFGRPGQREFGTYFIGYSRYLWVIDKMLQRMFVGDPPGAYDRGEHALAPGCAALRC